MVAESSSEEGISGLTAISLTGCTVSLANFSSTCLKNPVSLSKLTIPALSFVPDDDKRRVGCFARKHKWDSYLPRRSKLSKGAIEN